MVREKALTDPQEVLEKEQILFKRQKLFHFEFVKFVKSSLGYSRYFLDLVSSGQLFSIFLVNEFPLNIFRIDQSCRVVAKNLSHIWILAF